MSAAEHPAAIDWARSQLRDVNAAVELVWAGERATTYRFRDGHGAALAYLKVADGGALSAEADRLRWLADRLPVPAVLAFARDAGEGRLLTQPLHGADLADALHTADPHRLVGLLAAGIRRMHELDPASCPFGTCDPGHVIVHGDACLPNLVFDGTQLVGYLDVGELRLGAPEVDLAAAVWSLEYNLGPGFGPEFLRRYGWPATDLQTVEAFRLAYEAG